MKKFAVLVAVFFFFLFNTQAAFAESVPCTWIPPSGCVVNPSTNTCPAGTTANRSTCESITDQNDCNRTQTSCDQNSNVKCFKCDFASGGCAPAPADGSQGCPYTEQVACQTACTTSQAGKKYSCDAEKGCVLDPNGSLDYAVCEISCKAIKKQTSWERTSTCTDNRVGIETAIGCVPTKSMPDFVAFVLKFALMAAGGIIVLMVIATGYGLLTSQGNPEKLAAAKENLVSIFSGLILIVFSLVLLQTIGAGILGLPSFIP